MYRTIQETGWNTKVSERFDLVRLITDNVVGEDTTISECHHEQLIHTDIGKDLDDTPSLLELDTSDSEAIHTPCSDIKSATSDRTTKAVAGLLDLTEDPPTSSTPRSPMSPTMEADSLESQWTAEPDPPIACEPDLAIDQDTAQDSAASPPAETAETAEPPLDFTVAGPPLTPSSNPVEPPDTICEPLSSSHHSPTPAPLSPIASPSSATARHDDCDKDGLQELSDPPEDSPTLISEDVVDSHPDPHPDSDHDDTPVRQHILETCQRTDLVKDI
jgi:hypothetical protein